MKANRSWPGVPNRYITSASSTVIRPKSMATVVVVFAPTREVSSTSCDSLVIAASVVSGGISDTAETNVVFPTPNPPATTSLTDETLRVRGAAWSSAARSGRVAEVDQAARLPVDSKGPDTFDHPRYGRELDLDGVGRFEAAVVHQIADDHHRDTERYADTGRDLCDRGRLVARVDDAGLLEIEVVARVAESADRLDHRLH